MIVFLISFFFGLFRRLPLLFKNKTVFGDWHPLLLCLLPLTPPRSPSPSPSPHPSTVLINSDATGKAIIRVRPRWSERGPGTTDPMGMGGMGMDGHGWDGS
jgi:hypothetical protein